MLLTHKKHREPAGSMSETHNPKVGGSNPDADFLAEFIGFLRRGEFSFFWDN